MAAVIATERSGPRDAGSRPSSTDRPGLIAELERTLGARVPGGWTEAIPASLTAPSPPRRGSRPAGRASGTLRFQLAELAGLSSAAVVVEER